MAKQFGWGNYDKDDTIKDAWWEKYTGGEMTLFWAKCKRCSQTFPIEESNDEPTAVKFCPFCASPDFELSPYFFYYG
jgi:hypothetical protein